MADRPEEAVDVEPPGPFQGGELDVFETVPRTPSPNDLRLEESDHGFGQRVAVAVAPAADGRFGAGLGQSLGLANTEILRSAVAMVHKSATFGLAALADRLFQSVQRQVVPWRVGDPPADDAAGEHIDHEGDVDEAAPRGHIGQIRDPQLIVRSLNFDPLSL